MTTIAENLYTAINTNWGAGGGTKPSPLYIMPEDYQTFPADTKDSLAILLWTQDQKRKDISMGYQLVVSTIDIRISTGDITNKEGRLNTLVSHTIGLIHDMEPATYPHVSCTSTTKTETEKNRQVYTAIITVTITDIEAK